MKFGVHNLLIVCVFTMLVACSNDLSKVRDKIEEENPPNIISTDVEIIRSDSGIVQMVLKTPLRKDYSNDIDKYSIMPDGLTAFFFSKNQDTATVLTANYAILYFNEDVFVIKDSVRVKNTSGDMLRTQTLTWNNKQKTLYTTDYVEIERNGRILYGDGLRANEDFTNYEILTPKGSIAVD